MTPVTATFKDTYAGDVPVALTQRGKGWLWVAKGYVECGYRPVATAKRAVRNARSDQRFSNIREG